uniref:Coiled-coil domain containing 187 n=1 Tax=Rattus norvegicus TaxID=10116 RepID=D3ZUA4_RAT
MKEVDPYMKACSLPTWSACMDTRNGDSSVSSGRLSGSSGGHESCTLFNGPWKERPPLVLGPQRHPRKSNPRLEQLRDKIRAQAQWQGSCASLGTSAPSSVSYLCKTSSAMLRRKTPRVTNALPVPAFPGPGILRTAEHRGKDRASLGLRRELSKFPQHRILDSRTNIKKVKNISCKREISKSSILRRTTKGRGSDRKAAAVGASAAHTWLCKPTSAHNDQQVSKHTPSLAFHDQSTTIQGAMETLQDLRQQIQAGLELARSPRAARKLSPSKPKPQNLAGKRHQGPRSTQDTQGSFSKAAWTVTEGKRFSLGRAGNLHSQQHWKNTLAEQESCPQRAWTAQGQDTSFLRPGSTRGKPTPFSQRPWSALAWQSYPQRARKAQGQDTSVRRPGSPLQKRSPFSQRPWSALAGQAYSTCKDWEVFEPSLSRPHSALQDSWSNSYVQRSSPYSKSKSAVPPSSKVKAAWPEPAQDFPQSKPSEEQDIPCPRSWGSLGQPHSTESLGDFVRQKVQDRRQQSMEQKALAAHTLELRNQRLQEVYRKQREAVSVKAIPVVSQRSPGIVTFVPIHSGGTEAPGNLGSPMRKWSKVTSGMVLGDQEAPDSFCLCLNKPWNRTETQNTGCSPEGYKQARLQALETMAEALEQRIDILSNKLHKPTLPDTAGDLASDVLPLHPSTAPSSPTLIPPSYLRTVMSKGGRETSQDLVDVQTNPLLLSTYLQDGEMPLRPSWELQNPNLRTHTESQPQGPVSSTPASVSQIVPHTQPCPAGSSSREALSKDAIEGLEKKLQREMANLQALGACMRSSLGVPDAPDPTRGSLWQEEIPEAKKAGLVTPWTTRSCGQQEPERPHSRGLHDGHLTNFQLKSSSFLVSLKLDQQKQEQAMALLRQRAEQEVCETQMALDELLFKQQLKRWMEKPSVQQGPEESSKQKQQQMCGGPEPSTFSLHTMTTRSKDNTWSLKHLEEAKAVSAEPVQQGTPSSLLVPAKFHPSDRPTYQWNGARPEPQTEGPRDFHRFNVAMLEQSLRDEELRAQYQTAVLRLRELALEEKARAELAYLEHQRGCLGNMGREVAWATLCAKQQRIFSRLEKERKEIQYLKKMYLSLHQGRKQLLQHQQSILNVQRSMAHLRQELRVRGRLLKSCSPRVKTAWEEVSEASQKLEGHRSGSSQSHHPQEISESSESAHLSHEQKKVTPPQTTSAADEYLKQMDVTPGTRNPSMDSEHDGQGPGKQPCVFLPGLFYLSSLDPGHQKTPTAPVTKKDGSSVSQPKPQEAKELPPPGDLQTKPSVAQAVERPLATTESHAWSLQGQYGQSLSEDGPCPQEARHVAENRTSQGLDVSRSSKEEARKEAHSESEQQRGGACQQESRDVCSARPEAEQEAAPPAAPAAYEAEAQSAWRLDSPPCQPAAISELCSETASSNHSGSSEGPALSLTHSADSASNLSCASLQEFQKATATLVQLSDSPASLSHLEAEDTLLHADPSWSRELSAHDSWKDPGLPSFWGLHQGLPQLEGVPGNVEQVTPQRLEGGGARLLSGFSEEVAVAAGLEPDFSSLQAGWPLLFPRAPSPKLGSELSESSSQIWEENSENLAEPSPRVEPDSGSSLPTNGSLNLEGSGGPHTRYTSPSPGGEQEASRTHSSLSDTSNTEKTRQMSPVATFTVFPPQSLSVSDSTLSLSVPLDTSSLEGAGLSKVSMPTEASAGCQGEPQDAVTSPSMQRKPLQASPDSKVATTPQAPSEGGAPCATELASPSGEGGFLTEILSPVDEVLSYGSGDLTSSIHRVTHLLPPPPTPQAKSDISEPNPSSEDFPSPPEEAMFSGDSLDTLGEGPTITTDDMSSLSEEVLGEALSLGPQESGHLGASGQAGDLGDSTSTSPLSNGDGSAPGKSTRLSAQPLTSSPGSCVARDLQALDSQGGPRERVQCFKGAEHQQGIEYISDRREATSSPSWSTPSEGSPPGPVPVVPSGQAESLKHTSEEEKAGQSCCTEDQSKLQDLLGTQQLPRRDWAFDPVSEGACADLLGTGDAGPVDVVSTQLSRRILRESLAALSGLVPGDSP